MRSFLIRTYQDNQTLSTLLLFNYEDKIFECKTLELRWDNNKQFVSCIPEGKYEVIKHISPTFGKCFKLLNVKDRDNVLIHVGNFHFDTEGCLLVGSSFKDLDFDGLKDVTSSRKTLDKLLDVCPESFNLTILSS